MTAVLTTLSCLILLLCVIIYYVSKRKFNHWKNKKVPFLKPVPFLGNYGDYLVSKKTIGQVVQDICRKFPNAPYVGAFYGTEPALIVQDPEILKLIVTKDYYYFNSREISAHTHKEVVTDSIFFTHGDRWKVLRQNLTPLFSSAKMKNMFHLIKKCAHEFENMLDYETSVSNVVEMKSLMVRYTMDCIGSCVFGVDTNTMGKETKQNPFRIIGDMIFEVSNSRFLRHIARAIWPTFFYGLGFKVFPVEINTFFNRLISGVFEKRMYKPSSRNDFVDLFLNFKENEYLTGDSISNTKTGDKKKVNLKIDDDLLVGQCGALFAAGFETSANTLSFTLYEIAKNEEAQKRAIEEVDAYLRRHDGELTYNCISELPFVEACIDEALRLYPVLGVLTREAVNDYTLPTGLTLKKGTRVHLPVYHLHRHPDYFPDPEKYRPERFLPEEKSNIKPYTYMPFGEGPRICLGMRFAKMQIMPGLITLLKKYRIELAEGMPRTLHYDPRGFAITISGDLMLKLVPRSEQLR